MKKDYFTDFDELRSQGLTVSYNLGDEVCIRSRNYNKKYMGLRGNIAGIVGCDGYLNTYYVVEVDGEVLEDHFFYSELVPPRVLSDEESCVLLAVHYNCLKTNILSANSISLLSDIGFNACGYLSLETGLKVDDVLKLAETDYFNYIHYMEICAYNGFVDVNTKDKEQ